eukprot:164188-Pelagomonas_calceolata.AAC.8
MGFDLQAGGLAAQPLNQEVICEPGSYNTPFCYDQTMQNGPPLIRTAKGREGLHSCTCLRGQLS